MRATAERFLREIATESDLIGDFFHTVVCAILPPPPPPPPLGCTPLTAIHT